MKPDIDTLAAMVHDLQERALYGDTIFVMLKSMEAGNPPNIRGEAIRGLVGLGFSRPWLADRLGVSNSRLTQLYNA